MYLSRTGQKPNNQNFSGNGVSYWNSKKVSFFESLTGTKQRAALGVSALAVQPAIDYFNPMTDEKTRKFSLLKTVVKIVVGTITGIAIRGTISHFVTKVITKDTDKFLKYIEKPETRQKVENFLADKHKKKQFIDNVGTVAGLMGVAIGDFTFDMPLARFGIQKTADTLGMTEYENKGAKK